MSYLKELFKYWLGPAIAAAVLIASWWAWNDIQIKKTEVQQLTEQVDLLKQTITGNCTQILANQGFEIVEKTAEGVEENQ